MNKVAVRERYVFPEEVASQVVVLAVGEALPARARAAADEDTAFADFTDVTPELIEALKPQVVMSSVLGRNFDCVDLAERLDDMDYDGCYRLVGHGMPQPDLVLREIRSLFPRLTVEMDAADN